MHDIADQIRDIVTNAKPALIKLSPETVRKKERPDKWSKQEILGHLLDSAANNLQRIIWSVQNRADEFPLYNQDRWVEIQRYNDMDWTDLVELFYVNNMQLARVVEHIPDEALKNFGNMYKGEPVRLEFVITDYVRHLQHHMGQIAG
ncbi:DinB family protein [candidate division KSB1 bacterium]|nr:DinB family protein [candidate division KSB1 bacterium]